MPDDTRPAAAATVADARGGTRSSGKRALSERKKRTYRGLITLAISMLEEKGFEGVSMRELAEQAGITPMTIYNVFGNKEALLSAAIEYRTRRFIRRAFSRDQHGFDALLATNAEIIRQAIESNQLMRSVAGMLARDTTLFAVRQIYLVFHCCHVREMQADGLLVADAHPEAVTMMMMISHNSAINSWVNDEIDDRTVAALFDLQTCNALYPVLDDRARPMVDRCYRDRMTSMAAIDSESYFARSRKSADRFDITTLMDED